MAAAFDLIFEMFKNRCSKGLNFEYPSFGIPAFYAYKFVEYIHQMNAILIYFASYTRCLKKASQSFISLRFHTTNELLENAMPKSNNCWLSFLRRSSCSEIVAPIELVRLCTTWANLARRSASIYYQAYFTENNEFFKLNQGFRNFLCWF